MQLKRTIGIIVLMLGCFGVGAFAASNVEKIEAFLRYDFKVFHDGRIAEVGPVLLYNNRSYLPLRNVGELVGADVIWNADEQAIYVNSRFVGQPENPNVMDKVYEVIRLEQPYGYLGQYKGGTYPFLMNMTLDGKIYYRDNDIRRMGINTDGLMKVKEELTDELYVLESEIATIWDERILMTASFEPIVVGESDSGKLKAIKDYIDYLPERIRFLNRDNPEFSYYYPMILIVDAKGDNVYHILSQESGKFTVYELKLSQSQDGTWREAQSRTVNLE